MPRDLADVLHHLIPGSDAPVERPTDPPTHSQTQSPNPRTRLEKPTRELPTRGAEQPALPIVGIPIGDRDVVRAAFSWNLAVEVARIGARATVVAPLADRAAAMWPEESIRPLGVVVRLVPATNLEELARCAREVAAGANDPGPSAHSSASAPAPRADSSAIAREGGVVLVRIPPLWLRGQGIQGSSGLELLRSTLLFTSSDGRDLLESFGIVKLLMRLSPAAKISITVHGASRQGEAEAAFSKLDEVVRRRLAGNLTSCGLLVDDLHVYSAIVAQRPIGLVHPQSPAARSMRDVAELVLAEARASALSVGREPQ